MKKILSILLLISSLVGYSQGRVPYDDLTSVGTPADLTMYYEGALFSGAGYTVYSNGQLRLEVYFKDGRLDGSTRLWHSNGQMKFIGNFKDGIQDGIAKTWDEDGQLQSEAYYKDGQRI